MSATERLRELLDERGVEWSSPSGLNSRFADSITFIGNGAVVSEIDGSDLLRINFDGTPEQAVAATLGPGTCHDADVGGYFICSECEALVKLHDIGRSYVDECGKRWYATSSEHGLRFCPNCGRKVVG